MSALLPDLPPQSPAAVPGAVLFDAYGTLFDVYSVGALAEQLFPGFGERLVVIWRDKQIEYSRLCSMSGENGAHYRPFSELTRAGLRHAIERLRLPRGGDAEEQLMAQYLRLSPFPENREVLVELRARGIRTGILSNGDAAMLDPLVAHAGFDTLLDQVLSVDPVRRFKTDPAAYALGPQAFGLAAAQILFVSSNGWDALGATWYGYTTLWINRQDLPFESLDPPPTRIGRSLRDVLGFFPS